MGVYGPVSHIKMVTDEMVEYVLENHGIYTVVPVEGIMPEWVVGGIDYDIGHALAKLNK